MSGILSKQLSTNKYGWMCWRAARNASIKDWLNTVVRTYTNSEVVSCANAPALLRLTRCSIKDFSQNKLIPPKWKRLIPHLVRYTSTDGSAPQRNPSTGSSQQGNNGRPDNSFERLALLLTAVVVLGALSSMMPDSAKQQANQTEVSWTSFVNNYLKKGEVESVYLTKQSKTVYVKLHPGAVVGGKQTHGNVVLTMEVENPQNIEEKIREVEKELGIPADHTLKVVWKDFGLASAVMGVVLFVIISAVLLTALRTVGRNIQSINPFESITKPTYTRGDVSTSSKTSVRFKDIAGMEQAKVEIREYVEYLKNPSRFQNLGAKIPKGALLLGPPGCGKTLLAKAVASESEVPFLVMAGSDFVEMIGGLGASRMRQLFKDARNLRPCIIYIDEIDALGRSRSGGDGGASTGFTASESEHTLNQLLVEMDGMTDNSGIIMLASTNRADVLDRALLRPGRFDRHINIDLPTLSERKELFQMYLGKLNLAKPIGNFVDYLAQATPGMSGADIANICNEAALHAAREGNKSVDEGDLAYALDRIIAGQAKMTNTLSPKERKTIAYHECGHVLVGWMLQYTDPLLKVSIIPRTGAALGFAQYMPSDKKLYSREELQDYMTVALGGRAAEAIVFNSITTGAESDLDNVRDLAFKQIKSYGMGNSVGILAFNSDSSQDFQVKPYSKNLQQLMDIEANQMIADAYRKAERLLLSNRKKLDELCELLLKHEVMTYDDVKAVLGPRSFGDPKPKDFATILNTNADN